MSDTLDVLEEKIQAAKAKLPKEALDAISAVDWRAAVVGMRATKGYTFEQLGELDTETELVLCGLTAPEDYPKELQRRMNISKAETDALVNEMNELVFQKVREELIKDTEHTKKLEHALFPKTKPPIAAPMEASTPSKPVHLDAMELPAPTKPQSILAQKFSGALQTPAAKTEHTLGNISKTAPAVYPTHADPYRLSPDE